MKSFVRVAEIWVPDPDGYLLEFSEGLYDEAPEFGAISRSMCFGRGEGLPGRVWDEQRPIILKDLQGRQFQRSDAARAAGLSCAVGFPVYLDDRLTSVVVLFCGSLEEMSGAIEIWRNDPRVTTDLTLGDGLYGGRDLPFQAASSYAAMPRGVGLPGLAWQRGRAVFLADLSDATRFVRNELAAEAGILSGLALPCPTPARDNYVLTILSAPDTPIARAVESWVDGADGAGLAMAWSSIGSGADAMVPAPAAIRAFASGVAKIDRAAGQGSSSTATAAAPSRPGPLLAVPLASDGAVVETVVLYL